MNELFDWRKPYELPIYRKNKLDSVMQFVSATKRDEYKVTHPLTGEWSYDKDYTR